MHPEFRPMPTALIVDGPSLYVTARDLSLAINYEKLRSRIVAACGPRAKFYHCSAAPPAGKYSATAPLLKFLTLNGWTTVVKPLREHAGKVSASVAVEVAVTMLTAGWAQQLIVFSGEGDLVAAVDAVQRRGTRVVVVSAAVGAQPAVDPELRAAADGWVELARLADVIARPRAFAAVDEPEAELGPNPDGDALDESER